MTDRDVPFDPIVDEGVVERVQTTADGAVSVVVEFDSDGFTVAHASDATRSAYESETAMYEYFETVHEYVNLDLAEIDLFTENLFPEADGVRYITTALDIGKMIRVYVGDRRGVFVVLPVTAEVEPVVESLFDAIGR